MITLFRMKSIVSKHPVPATACALAACKTVTVLSGTESNADKIRKSVKKMVAALPK